MGKLDVHIYGEAYDALITAKYLSGLDEEGVLTRALSLYLSLLRITDQNTVEVKTSTSKYELKLRGNYGNRLK